MQLRILSLTGGLLALATAYLHYWSVTYFGFPDGHRTELEIALIPIYWAFVGICLACAAYFAYLAGAVRQIRRVQIAKGTAIYLVSLGALLSISYYLSLHLDHGQGG